MNNPFECDVTFLSIPGGPLITEDAAGNFILVGILEAETSTKVISDKIRNQNFLKPPLYEFL